MRFLLRLLPIAFGFAMLAGPGDPINWLLGTGFAMPLAIALSGLRPATPAEPARLLLLPWFALGVLLRAATGTVRTAHFLLRRREGKRVGLIRCRAIAETEHGRTLLALADTISPGSVVIERRDEIRMSAIDADAGVEHCRGLRAWHARFQRKMTG